MSLLKKVVLGRGAATMSATSRKKDFYSKNSNTNLTATVVKMDGVMIVLPLLEISAMA